MMSYSTQNYSSLKKSTWPHILMVGQTWSNVLKTCIIWYGSLQPTPLKKNFVHEIRTCVMEEMRVLHLLSEGQHKYHHKKPYVR